MDSSNLASASAAAKGKQVPMAFPSGVEHANIHNSFDSDCLRFDRPSPPLTPSQTAFSSHFMPGCISKAGVPDVIPSSFNFPAVSSRPAPPVATMPVSSASVVTTQSVAASSFCQPVAAIMDAQPSTLLSTASLPPREPRKKGELWQQAVPSAAIYMLPAPQLSSAQPVLSQEQATCHAQLPPPTAVHPSLQPLSDDEATR